MRTRKGIFTAILFLLILSSCSDTYPEHPDYDLTLNQYGYYSTINRSGELWEQFGLTLQLTSKSGNLTPIYLMTCSWSEHATTNNKNIGLGTPCDANFMTWESIGTDEYLELTTIAHAVSGFDPTSSKLRIALIAIDTTEMDFSFYLTNPKAENYLDSLKSQKGRFIWSNEISLERLNYQEQLKWGQWEKKEASNML
ncbi:hypothetical protein [Reichenbachiella sp.]|uniref:hypothetical protein n=1 Tax=Reichenbachiella sp. TaxID=2184521 RepID=UPI003BAEB886